MRILLDTNVVLDVLLNRLPWHAEAEAILTASRTGQIDCAISALTIANVFYIGRRQMGAERAREIVRVCLRSFEILPIDRRVLDEADLLGGSDFEDNIQIVSAALAAVDAIVTRDPQGFSGSTVPVLTPQELVASLNPPPAEPE